MNRSITSASFPTMQARQISGESVIGAQCNAVAEKDRLKNAQQKGPLTIAGEWAELLPTQLLGVAGRDEDTGSVVDDLLSDVLTDAHDVRPTLIRAISLRRK